MERVTYDTLKQWFFNDAYLWCQRKFKDGKIKKWHSDFDEWGEALDSFDNSFDTPIENLMLNVIYIITNAGRHNVSHNIVLDWIDEILSKNDLNDLISPLSEEEKNAFLYDLHLVLNNRQIEE